jgi:hypothetical protein
MLPIIHTLPHLANAVIVSTAAKDFHGLGMGMTNSRAQTNRTGLEFHKWADASVVSHRKALSPSALIVAG